MMKGVLRDVPTVILILKEDWMAANLVLDGSKLGIAVIVGLKEGSRDGPLLSVGSALG